MFLIKHGIQYDRTGNAYLAFEHSTQAKALYQRLIDAGLKGELVIAP
jgi:predicted aspartyl protease